MKLAETESPFLKLIFLGWSFYILKASNLPLSLINYYYGIKFWLLIPENFLAAYSLEVTGAQLLRPRVFITWDSSFWDKQFYDATIFVGVWSNSFGPTAGFSKDR